MGEREVPLGINTAVGAVAVVVCILVPAGVDAQGRDARFAVLALGVAAVAATVVDLAAVAVTAGVAFLLFDGFVEGTHGDLVWQGRADVVRVGILCLAGAFGLAIGVVRLRAERRALPPEGGTPADGEVSGNADLPADRDDRPGTAEQPWALPRQRTSVVAGERPPSAGATPSEPRQ